MQRNSRSLAIVILVLFAGNANSGDQPTLDELKVIGAAKSSYLRPLRKTKKNEKPKANLQEFAASIKPVLNQHCLQCHGPDIQEGSLRIDTLDPNLLTGNDAQWWVEVQAVITNGEMPPTDEPPLPDKERSIVSDWLSSELQMASTVRRQAGGHSSFRRLTRYEFNYAMQDLLGLPWNFARDLPPEASSEDGFQNSSEMLHMSVRQLNTYRRLARKALQRAIPIGPQPPVRYWNVTMKEASRLEWPKHEEQVQKAKQRFKEDPERLERELKQLADRRNQPHRNTYYENVNTGETVRASWAYYNAKYAIAPTDAAQPIPNNVDHLAIIPQGRNQHLIIELGDQLPDEGTMQVRIHASRASKESAHIPSMQLDFGWRASNEGRSTLRVGSDDIAVSAAPGKPEAYEFNVVLGDIYPRNSVRGVTKLGQMPNPSEYISLLNSSATAGDLRIDYVQVAAPVYESWPPASYRRVFIDSEHKVDETDYAREVLAHFMHRAWRRPVSAKEVESKLQYFEELRKKSESLEEAMIEVLATVIASPHMLYISEFDDSSVAQDATDTSQFELASRLSLFLWSSIPDDELMQFAAKGQLGNSATLMAQVDRMLKDPRSQRFMRHFVEQWLGMESLGFLDIQRIHPQITQRMKDAFEEEPQAFFEELVRNDESVLNFIHANYVMTNELLAQHYRIEGIDGNKFRRVALKGNDQRGGLLTQAGLLAMNSAGKDSHPLKRGVWLLETLLNDPPPPPPPAVPEIDLADPEILKMTLKQRLEDHRNQAACKSCHAKIDPWGIAFENYDALGLWRNQIDGRPVDATSELASRQPLDGMDGLKRYLLEHRQDQFVRAIVYKLTTYALGRPLTFADHSDIDSITMRVRKQGDGLRTVVREIVASDLFQQ